MQTHMSNDDLHLPLAPLIIPCNMKVLELPNKSEKVHTFAWEPKGHRFCILHGDGPRPNISFYSMRDDKGKLAVRLLGGCCRSRYHTMASVVSHVRCC